jgi:thiol-disulfide isomerase/thioredoxin
VPGASICSHMGRHQGKNPGDKMTYGYDDIAKTDANGIAHVSYDDLRKNSVLVRDEAHKQMGIASVTPVSLEKLAVTVQLQPECLLAGKIERGVLPGGGENAMWTNVILEYGGEEIAYCESFSGDYEFHVPPGDYSLLAYGDQTPRTIFSTTVPVGQSAMEAKPIELVPPHLGTLVGKPAMELHGVVGWKGTPTKLAGCKGKFVLLDFWGYWCHPCVLEMPNLMELYDRFKDSGLVVIGVHQDAEGEVTTADQLDARLVQTRKQFWQGKDIPFPVALVSGDQRLASKQYGVSSYPTTILID